jgi:uncharacterized protein
LSAHSHNLPLLIESWSAIVPFTVLVASILGSLHCAGMCGALAISFSRGKGNACAYHAGRLFAYSLLGALAGVAGEHLFHIYWPVWIGPTSITVFAIYFVWMGFSVFRGKGMHPPFLSVLARLSRVSWPLLSLLPKSSASFSAGLMTALLPCGWLYSFVIASAALQSPAKSALFMTAFWAGTVPSLVAAVGFTKGAVKIIGSGSPKVAGIMLMAAGLLTLALKLAH